MMNGKIIGVYGYNNGDKKEYCYVFRNTLTGKLSYHFLSDEAAAKKAIIKYANDNNLKASDADTWLNDTSHIYLNCKDIKDVQNRVISSFKEEANTEDFSKSYSNFKEEEKSANKSFRDYFDNYFKKDTNTQDFKEEKEDREDNKVSLRTRVWNFIKGHKVITGVVLTALTIAGIGAGMRGCSANKYSGPSVTSNEAITMDDDIKDKKDQEIEAQAKEEEQTQNTGGYANTQTTTSYTGGGSGYTGGSVTTTPGSVDNSLPAFQDPNASLDNSNNNNNNNDNTETTDDNYDNVYEEETPVDDNTVTDDYDEVIDVPASGEPNKDNIDYDDRFEGNEGALGGDLSYEFDSESNSENNEYEQDFSNAPLPDPNETATAGDGDYNTTEEELQDNTNVPTEESTIPVDQSSEEVPVYQEESTTTTDMQTDTTNINSSDNVEVVDQAIEAMANGENVDLTYNAETGELNLEQADNTNTETNSMTK